MVRLAPDGTIERPVRLDAVERRQAHLPLAGGQHLAGEDEVQAARLALALEPQVPVHGRVDRERRLGADRGAEAARADAPHPDDAADRDRVRAADAQVDARHGPLLRDQRHAVRHVLDRLRHLDAVAGQEDRAAGVRPGRGGRRQHGATSVGISGIDRHAAINVGRSRAARASSFPARAHQPASRPVRGSPATGRRLHLWFGVRFARGRWTLSPGRTPRFRGTEPTGRGRPIGHAGHLLVSAHESAGHAGRLFDRLTARFGEDRVFMDVDTLGPSDHFATRIEKAIDLRPLVASEGAVLRHGEFVRDADHLADSLAPFVRPSTEATRRGLSVALARAPTSVRRRHAGSHRSGSRTRRNDARGYPWCPRLTAGGGCQARWCPPPTRPRQRSSTSPARRRSARRSSCSRSHRSGVQPPSGSIYPRRLSAACCRQR